MNRSYEMNNRLLADMFASGDSVVGMVALRLSTLSQVEDANSAAWQAAYDKAIKDGRNESQATRIANEKVPQVTADQEAAIVSGDSSGADIPGVPDSPAPTPNSSADGDAGGDQVYPPTDEAKALVERYGGRYLDPNTPAIDQIGETEFLIDDPSDSYGLRQIIVPVELTSNMQVQMTRALARIDDPNEKQDPPKRDGRVRTPSISETDPYIRTPESYRYDPGGVAKENFPKTYLGRSLAVTPDDRRRPVDRPKGYESERPDEYKYKRPKPQTDYAEAEFINKAQGLGGNVRGVIPQYRESDLFDMISNMSLPQILEFQALSADAGFYGEAGIPSLPGQVSLQDQQILGSVMGQANVSGDTVWPMLEQYAEVGRSRQQPGPTGYVKEPFSVPAQLRQIPGEKTLAEEVKYRFRQKLGRDATDEELLGVANELGGYYTKSNQEQIALYLAAYNGDNQGLLTGAQMQSIEDPGAATSFDIAEKWKNEIDLNKRRETNSESFSRMLAATMGNRPSIGNQTAAGGVAQIGRQ